MSRDKPLWLPRGIKTATFQLLHFEDLHVFHQVLIWHSKAPKCWFQILSKWAVISHSDWGEASKLQHFNCSILKTCMCFYSSSDIKHSKAPKCWFQILSKWAVISHSDWGKASKLQHFNCSRLEDLHLSNQAVIWHSKALTCWLQILSKWAVISHSDWGLTSKLQHFKASILTSVKISYDSALASLPQRSCNFQRPQHNRVDSPRPQNADSRFSLNEPW